MRGIHLSQGPVIVRLTAVARSLRGASVFPLSVGQAVSFVTISFNTTVAVCRVCELNLVLLSVAWMEPGASCDGFMVPEPLNSPWQVPRDNRLRSPLFSTVILVSPTLAPSQNKTWADIVALCLADSGVSIASCSY